MDLLEKLRTIRCDPQESMADVMRMAADEIERFEATLKAVADKLRTISDPASPADNATIDEALEIIDAALG